MHALLLLQAAQEVLKGKDSLEPGIEKVLLIKLQKIVAAGACRQL